MLQSCDRLLRHLERQNGFDFGQLRSTEWPDAAPLEKGVPGQFRLLLQAVIAKSPPGPVGVGVAAEGVAHQWKVEAAAALCLPDVRQVVSGTKKP